MTEADRAIIVGINRYPGLSDLDGPEHDAEAFERWVTSPTGGNVPQENVRLIRSSGYPERGDALKAEPTVEAIQGAVDELLQAAETSQENGTGYRAGRRLYLYFAGHGFEPQPEQVALLTANATRRRGYHVAGRIYADYFRRAGIFDEVLLFMDCCREPLSQIPLYIPPYMMMKSNEAPEKARWMNAYATKWSRKSRERMVEGKARGIFTVALLKGLSGQARDPVSGDITDASLADYLYEHMKDPLTPEELNDPEIPKQPDIDYDKDPANRITIVKAPPAASFPVVFQVPPSAMGKSLTVLDSRFQTVFETALSGDRAVTQLPQGYYLAEIMADRVRVPFQVPSNEREGSTHVTL
ncbi:MAG TPA: caspase family protein [Hyalangium sp.]|jgi:hypothetical protein|nr:caspase family protein [Hyalangium sp.]